MMTELLEQAIDEVRKLPQARRDEAAEVLLGLVAQDPGSVRLSETQLKNLQRRLDGVSDTRASDDDVAETYRRLGA